MAAKKASKKKTAGSSAAKKTIKKATTSAKTTKKSAKATKSAGTTKTAKPTTATKPAKAAKKAPLATAPAKPAARRRSGVVRIPTHEQIERRAYELWEAKGRPSGRDADNWAEAEAELMAELQED